ncbi:disulfide bond formation protein B [Pusillimonas sp. ANT_WB101]|uniref:disulfide bond formation protein B n=1 Tax=Pusillimonas sp. ANT_WB101 TaxID=2597356 RepID=UPI0011F07255|nr:disulfide bond formation protein B [Pusillimonas sp. ANT_WB101]KAA0910983.1 disulfide bond formation protein B [Pusillimonas sp. ANT_WB101]
MTLRNHALLHLIALLCVGAVGFALVTQHVFGMRPCAWCVLQRLMFLVIAIVCWAGVLLARFKAGFARLSAGLVVLLSMGGIAAAWYQYAVASMMFSCDRTFADRFMVSSGLDAGVPWLFGIFSTCMDARVTLLGVEYALWSMALFALIGVLALTKLLRRAD